MSGIMHFILQGLSTNAIRHPKTVISILAVAVFVSLFFVSQVQMVTSSETFFPKDSVVYNDFKAYQKDFGTDTVFVMVKSENVLEPYVFDYLARLERQLQGLDYGIHFKSKGNWHYFNSKSNTTSRLLTIPRLTKLSSFNPHRC